MRRALLARLRTAVLAHALWAVSTLGALADPITLDQARLASETFLARHVSAKNQASLHTRRNPAPFKRALRQTDLLSVNGHAIGFVSHWEPGGYFLLRADDDLPAVKLYSETDGFTNLPPAFLQVIREELAGELAALKRLKSEGKRPRPRDDWAALFVSASTPVPQGETGAASPGTVLLQTAWDQDNPYNCYSPVAGEGPGGRAYAGCVACAMAQILRYHQKPASAAGDKSYVDNAGSCTGTHRMSDAGLGDYAWTNMPGSISNSSPVAQKQAVGRLLYHCGVAVAMDFEADGSGAHSEKVPTALSGSFRFTSSALLKRSGYSTAAWYNKIVQDIDSNQPIYYAMENSGSGHALVCDGYQNGNEIHLNLGWGGSGNAWYNMDNIQIDSDSWYNHRAVFAIAPIPVPTVPVIQAQPLSQSVAAGTTALFTVVAGGYPAPAYQWRFNGIRITGATSSELALNNVRSSAAGDYTVVVTNSSGSVTSTVAALVVIIPPAITFRQNTRDTMTLSWLTGEGAFVLMQAPTVTGSWTHVPEMPPVTVPTTGAVSRFYRLRWEP
jgi:hypothetical protein